MDINKKIRELLFIREDETREEYRKRINRTVIYLGTDEWQDLKLPYCDQDGQFRTYDVTNTNNTIITFWNVPIIRVRQPSWFHVAEKELD